MKFHHIGIACRDIQTLSRWISLMGGKRVSDNYFDMEQDATVALFTLSDNTLLEAVTGKTVQNLISKHIAQYHICYEVEHYDETVQQFIEAGSILVAESKEAILFSGRRVCFLHTPIGLIELLDVQE